MDPLIDQISTYHLDQDYPDNVNKSSLNTYTPDTVRGFVETNDDVFRY